MNRGDYEIYHSLEIFQKEALSTTIRTLFLHISRSPIAQEISTIKF